MAVSSIALAQRIISLSLVPLCLVVGTLGNILNCLVFASRRVNSASALYLLVMSLADLGTVWIGFFPRFLSPLLGYDPVQTNSIICKIRQYFVSLTLVLLRHFLCVISINQILVISYEQGRQGGNLVKKARWVTIMSVIFWAILTSPSPIFYDVRNGVSCSPQVGAYATYVTVYNLMIPIIIPVTIISICSCIIIKKIRRVFSLVIPLESSMRNATNRIREQQKIRKELQMTRLILIQGLVYIVLNLPNTIYTFYFLATMNDSSKSSDRLSIESFISWFCQMLLAVYCTITIFLYVVTSSKFRHQCFDLLRRLLIRH
jgi:hypothetical protein